MGWLSSSVVEAPDTLDRAPFGSSVVPRILWQVREGYVTNDVGWAPSRRYFVS